MVAVFTVFVLVLSARYWLKSFNADVITDSPANILSNGNFESVTGSLFSSWTPKENPNSFFASVDGQTGKGLKIEAKTAVSSQFPMVYSEYIPVSTGDAYKVSFYYNISQRSNVPVYMYCGSEVFDSQKVGLRAWPGNMVAISSSNTDGNWHQAECYLYPVKSPAEKFFQLKLGGPYSAATAIVIDDVNLQKYSFGPEKVYGCHDDADSKCLDIGSATDQSSLVPIAPATLVTTLSESKTEDTTTFRNLNNLQNIVMNLDSWEVDENGVPKNDLMLEIRYKDTFAADPLEANYYSYTGETTGKQGAYLSTRIDFTGANKYTTGLIELGDIGDNQWKTAQLLFPKSDFQLLRSFDGKYSFKINMLAPVITGTTLNLPIDYLSLTKVTAQDAQAYKQREREMRMFTRADYIEAKPRPNIPGDFVWFTSPSTEQIFPNSYPKQEEINKAVELQSTLDEVESGNFSILTNKDLNNLSLVATDLNSGNNKIESSQISLKKVVYDDKFWMYTSSIGVTNNKFYGLQPDRYESFDRLNILANMTQQFYFTITIPEKIGGGIYSGSIKIMVNGVEKAAVPVSVEVLPISLDKQNYEAFLYNNPQNIGMYNFFGDSALQDIAEHGLTTANIFESFSPKLSAGEVVFDYVALDGKLAKSIAAGAIKDKAFYWNLDTSAAEITKVLGLTGTVWEKYADPKFVKAFLSLIDGLQGIAHKNNIEIFYSVNDEPGTKESLRMSADRLYPLLRQKNVRTWVTYLAGADQPIQCATCRTDKTVVTLPSIDQYLDYKLYAMRNVTAENVNKDPSTFGFYTTGQATLRNPIYTRFMQGIYAVKTDAKMVGTYSYFDYIGNPYNDFDTLAKYRFPSIMQDLAMVYPTWSHEIIPTTAWEATREGIKDAKYIATLQNLIKQNPTNEVAKEASAYLSSILSRVSKDYVNDYIGYYNEAGYSDKIIGDLSEFKDPAIFDQIRTDIYSFIKRLNMPTVKITSDQTEVSSGDVITVTVIVKNPNQKTLNNVAIQGPIMNGTTYIDGTATMGGNSDGKNINWSIPQLLSNHEFSATYQLKVN